jgi:hypothetical protein
MNDRRKKGEEQMKRRGEHMKRGEEQMKELQHRVK